MIEPRYRLRVYLLTALVLFGFGVLLSRLYEFQIEKQKYYKDQIPRDRQITVREPGIRGVIKDRRGIELARNKRQYEVSFNLEEIHRAYRLQREQDPTIAAIKNDGGIKRPEEITDIVEIVKERVIGPLTDLGLARNFNAEAMRVHYKTHGGLVALGGGHTEQLDGCQLRGLREIRRALARYPRCLSQCPATP